MCPETRCEPSRFFLTSNHWRFRALSRVPKELSTSILVRATRETCDCKPQPHTPSSPCCIISTIRYIIDRARCRLKYAQKCREVNRNGGQSRFNSLAHRIACVIIQDTATPDGAIFPLSCVVA